MLSLSYEEYLGNFKDILKEVFQLAPTPLDVDKLEAENLKKEFVIAFRDLSNTLIKLKPLMNFNLRKMNSGLQNKPMKIIKGNT